MNVVDIGANIGYYALPAAKASVREESSRNRTNPVAFECLERNVASNRLRNVELRKVVVGELCMVYGLRLVSAHAPLLNTASYTNQEAGDTPTAKACGLLPFS